MADYRAVRKPAEEALEICRAAGLDWHLVPSLYCLSVAHRGLGEYQMALHLSQEALQVSEDIGSPRFLSFVFHQLAMHYQDLDLLDQAELFFQRALQASEEVNSAFWLPTIQAGLAVTQLRQGYLMVGPQLEETLAAALERGQKQQAAHCLEGLAEIAIAGGKAEKAIEYANRLKKLAEPGCMRERMAQAHRWRGIALQALGQSEAAGEELDEAARLSQVIGSPRLLWDVHDALAGYYDELGNRELAVHHQDEVQKIVAGIAAGLEDEELKAGLPLDSN
jgi:tetratricopeptide (TPR) repeat protein